MSEAKVSQRDDVDSVTITAPAALDAAPDARRADLAAAGSFTEISFVDGGGDALTCDVTIAPPSDDAAATLDTGRYPPLPSPG